jgi:hypothetical protein
MATKKTPADKLRERLAELNQAIPQDLRLSSLEENRLEGYAYLFRIVLPLLNADCKPVFTDSIMDEFLFILNDRFGGCKVTSSSSAPPLWGLWYPTQASQPEKDYLTTAEVLANPIEAPNRFFCGLEADPENCGAYGTAGNLDFTYGMPVDFRLAREGRDLWRPVDGPTSVGLLLQSTWSWADRQG